MGSGSSPVQFNGYGIAIDPSNNVYVADSFEDKVQKFTSTGLLVTEFGSTGSGDGQFNIPHDVAIDSSGVVYVADTYNSRIQVFAPHTSTPPDTTITSALDGNGAQVQNGGSTRSNQIIFQFTSSGGTSWRYNVT